MRTKQVVLTTLIAALMLLSLMPIAFAAAPAGAPPDPSNSTSVTVLQGVAAVDGDPSEWDLGATYAATMYTAWNSTKPALADLYLQYDCTNHIMYALVKSRFDYPVQQSETEAWIAKGTASNKITFSAFAWVYSSSTVVGWEASFPLVDGDLILVHTNVDTGEWETAGTSQWLEVHPSCPPPTAVGLVSFDAQSTARSIVLSWETASEIDNLGFNLYRAESADGPWTRLNANLIPSLVAPGSPVGAAYTYADSVPQRGVLYFYRLESVDVYGHAASYGPVNATLQLLKRTLIRPRLDAGLTQK